MSGFRESLKDSPEYRAVLTAVQKRRLPLGVLGLSAIHKAHIADALCAALRKRALIVMPDEASATKRFYTPNANLCFTRQPKHARTNTNSGA